MIDLDKVLKESVLKTSPYAKEEIKYKKGAVMIAMKEAIKQALELAGKDAKCRDPKYKNVRATHGEVDKESILNVMEKVK